MAELQSTKAMDKLNSELENLCVWLSSDPEYILSQCGDILSMNEYKMVERQSGDPQKIKELMRIIIQNGDDTCERFLYILKEHRGRYPQLTQLFVTEAQDSSTPTVCAENGSFVSIREIKNTSAKNISLQIQTTSQPTNYSPVNVKPATCYTAGGGSVIIADKISGSNVGDISYSVYLNTSQENTGTVEDTQPSPQGSAVRAIKTHKVELIECLMVDLFILQHVHAKKIICDRQYGNLKHSTPSEQTITNLLDLLIFSGQETCARFLQLLKDPAVVDTYPRLKYINIYK